MAKKTESKSVPAMPQHKAMAMGQPTPQSTSKSGPSTGK